jgi:hypothetical protein
LYHSWRQASMLLPCFYQWTPCLLSGTITCMREKREANANATWFVIDRAARWWFVRANSKKVGTDPTFSRRIFSLTNHIAKICFSLRAKTKIRLVENGLKDAVQSDLRVCTKEPSFYLQTFYLGFYFISCSCKAWLLSLDNLLYSRIMKI